MNSKPWYASMTVWAASFVGFLQTVPDIINQVNAVAPGLHLATNPIVMKILTIIGVIVAIYGRLKATTTLTPVKSPTT